MEEVRILEASDVDAFRVLGDSLSPIGSVSAKVSCISASLDAACRLAGRRRLLEIAHDRAADVAVVTDEAFLESDPPEYELTATLYASRVYRPTK